MPTIVTIEKLDNNFNCEYFFSTDHCQPGLGEKWVPVTHYNTTREEVKKQNEEHYPVIGATSKEIPNPNPEYQA